MSRMSSPQSSFSSPCRRSPRILSTAGSPMSSTASSLPTHRPNLSRRWSLDNLSTQREGYVRDLRRQHQRDRVEVYPFMLTERHSLRQSPRSDATDASTSKSIFSPSSILNERRNSAARCTPSSPSKMSTAACRRTRSFSLDINEEVNVIRGRHRIAMSATASAIQPVRHFGLSYSSSVDISTTTVPEDTELNCINPILEEKYESSRSSPEIPTSGYHRKRSSSLPRILPPILDDDDDATANDHETALPDGHRREQTSSLIVRELQKFICRQADDVSLVLPLPLPNRRQSRLVGRSGEVSTTTSANRWRHGLRLDAAHIRVLLRAVAKIHACAFALKCKTPRLFDEMISSLEGSSSHASSSASKRYLSMERDALVEAIRATPLITAVTPKDDMDDIIASLYRQFDELHSATSAKPFPVIVHGDIRPENVTFTQADVPGDEPRDARLSGLSSATIGSPLLDIYAVIFNCASVDARVDDHDLLSTYFDAFVDISTHLRVKASDFTLDHLVNDFKKFELAGVLCAAAASAADEGCLTSSADKQCLAKKMRNLSLDIPCDLPTIK